MSIVTLYTYGLDHGYFNNWTHFQKVSEETIEQVADIMFKERTGHFRTEYADLYISNLEESINDYESN